MEITKEKELRDKYPIVLKGRLIKDKKNNTYYEYPCSFHIGIGWYPLVEDLIKDINEYLMTLTDIEKRAFCIHDIKEKFGGLRFYADFDRIVLDENNQEIDISSNINLMVPLYPYIRRAENKSYSTCEDCGEKGVLRDGSWIRTLCDNHAIERGMIKCWNIKNYGEI